MKGQWGNCVDIENIDELSNSMSAENTNQLHLKEINTSANNVYCFLNFYLPDYPASLRNPLEHVDDPVLQLQFD